MDLLTIYLMVMLPSIGEWILGVAGISLFFSFIALIFIASDRLISEEEDEYTFPKKAPFVVIPIFLLAFLLTLVGNLVPDKEEMYTIIGGYFVTNIEGIDKLPENVIESANKFLEEYNKDKE